MAVVTGSPQLIVGFNQTVTAGLIQTQTLPAGISLTTQYTNGTGAGAIDLVYAKQLTLVASTPQTLDLTSILDLSGATISFARVREMVLQVVTATSGYKVTIGAAASNPWAPFWGTTGTDIVFGGSTRYFTDPTSIGAGIGAVTSGTSKSLKLDPGSNTIVCNLIIAGCSAVS
jgi:hypothetical protein